MVGVSGVVEIATVDETWPGGDDRRGTTVHVTVEFQRRSTGDVIFVIAGIQFVAFQRGFAAHGIHGFPVPPPSARQTLLQPPIMMGQPLKLPGFPPTRSGTSPGTRTGYHIWYQILVS